MAGARDAAPRRKSSTGVQSPRLDAWREGGLTFEEAITEVLKSLVVAPDELHPRLDYALSPSPEDR